MVRALAANGNTVVSSTRVPGQQALDHARPRGGRRSANATAAASGGPAKPSLPHSPKADGASKPARAFIEPRSGRVVIVGQPNVGKSTLLNALLGQKLAITSAKPGTTRSVLLGVYDGADDEGRRTQIAFIDTPGLEQPRSVLGRALVEEAQGALEGMDAVLLLVDAQDAAREGRVSGPDLRILELARERGRPIVLVLTKVDRVKDKRRLLPALAALGQTEGVTDVVPVSGRTGQNVERLVVALRPHLHDGLSFDPDVLTDRPERFFVAELLREAILDATRQEVPHGVAVTVDEWVTEGRLVRVACTVVVDKDSHKGILLGAKGATMKAIATAAREEMERFLERKVFLRTFVKVVEGWTKDPVAVRRLAREGVVS